MARSERVVERAMELATREVERALRRKRRRRRRRRGTWQRLLRAALWIAIATFIVVPAMVAGGFLLGPSGVEGLISAPLILMTLWAAILYWHLGRRPRLPAAVATITSADLARLPEQTEQWLEHQRHELPYAAQDSLDHLSSQLESLSPQLVALDPQVPAAAELRRLLAEELPELVTGYKRVPRAMRAQASHGGTSPEQQLVTGLATIDQQLARIHERLAAEDLRALATHNRYLELKYKKDADDELK